MSQDVGKLRCQIAQIPLYSMSNSNKLMTYFFWYNIISLDVYY